VAVSRPAFAPSPARFRQTAEPLPGGIKLGGSVSHPMFGAGVVTDLEGDGAHARVQVNFEEAGSKWLVLAYSKLSPA
jgi:DNA helicase II / ATP-dependent DNA helicase PcrA